MNKNVLKRHLGLLVKTMKHIAFILVVFCNSNSLLFAGTRVFRIKVFSNAEILTKDVQKTVHGAKEETKNDSWVLQGLVTDENDEPLPGVSVSVKGTTIGTVTDADGKFLIEISNSDYSLTLTYIGYKTQTINVGNKRRITVKMEPDLESQKLNEVVVVGFGTQKKVSVTGAISNVSMSEVERVSTPSISNAIAGKLPGIVTRQSSGEPGADAAQVYIRGIGTFGTNQGPLILVDGIERNMNNLNAEEIESFSILKDASATAVYGVRGANGVILINTKRGVLGKPKITFRTEAAMLTPLRLPKYINGAEYASLMNEALTRNGAAPQFSEEDIELFSNGTDPYFHPNVDWTNYVLRDQTYQSISNLNISGGSKTMRYFTNVGYTLGNGIYQTDNLNEYNTNALVKRYNFRSNVDLDLSETFTLELGLGGIIQNGNYPGAGTGIGTGSTAIFDALRINSPIAFPIKNPDGSPGGTTSTGELGTTNPWGMVMHTGYIRQDRNVLQGTFGAKWDLSKAITQGLSVRGKFGYDHYYQGDQQRRKNFEVKGYMGLDPNGQEMYQVYREATALGYVPTHDVNRRLYSEAAINYGRTFGKHDLSGMLLGNMAENINLSTTLSIENIPTRRQAVAGRATYGYDNKYFAEFNFGYNGSENFPEGKKFGFFPAVSAGWVVSNEKFWGVDFINQLKLRGSYGTVGNDEIGQRFLYISRIAKNAPGFHFGEGQTFFGGFSEDLIANADVTWEVATKRNLGFDLGLFNDKVILQVDAFRDIRKDILVARRTVSEVAGYMASTIPYANLGKVKNQGIDALLEIRNRTKSGLFFSVRGNFTFARNERLETDQPEQLYPYLSEKGQPVGRPLGLIALGLFQSPEDIANSPVQTYAIAQVGDIKYKDLNGDNVINDFDQTFIGYSRLPEISFGFGGTLAYKGFDFSAYFTGAARTSTFMDGRSMYPFSQGFGTGAILREYYDNRWTPENTAGYYPGAGTGNNLNNFRTSTYYMKDASYLRLRNVELGFTIPKNITKKLKMEKVRMFLNGMNLYTWDKLKIIDPESNYGTGGYPLQKSTNFGLLVNF